MRPPLSLALHGTFAERRDAPLEALAEHFLGVLSEQDVEIFAEGERRELALVVHPAALPVRVTSDGREVLLIAETAPGGPGYHVRVLELAEAAARELGITWDVGAGAEARSRDETGYLEHRDLSRLERSMSAWAIDVGVALALDRGPGGHHLFMPESPRPVFEGFAATTLGIRDRAFFEGLADGGSQRELFAWWDVGTEGAGYHRGLALALLWNEIAFREPLADRERETMDRALDALEAARAADPGLALPFDAWREVARLRGRDAPTDTDATGVRVGYRRGRLSWTVGPFVFDIDGDLAPDDEDEDLGDDAPALFAAGCGARYAKIVFFEEPGDAPSAAVLLDELRDDDLPPGAAARSRDDGDVHLGAVGFDDESEVEGLPIWTTLFSVAVPGGRARGHLSSAREDAGWAEGVLGTFRVARRA